MTEHDEGLLQQAVLELLEREMGFQQGLSLEAITQFLDKQPALKSQMDQPEAILDTVAMSRLLLKYFKFEYGVYCLASCCKG